MRSLKVERKPRDNPRARATRKPARGPRERKSAPAYGARDGEDGERLVARLLRPLLGIFRRPILLMTLGLVLFAAIAALFASGMVGRAIHGVDDAIDTVMADAGFGISEIHLAGNSRVPPETILAALGMRPGESIFAVTIANRIDPSGHVVLTSVCVARLPTFTAPVAALCGNARPNVAQPRPN